MFFYMGDENDFKAQSQEKQAEIYQANLKKQELEENPNGFQMKKEASVNISSISNISSTPKSDRFTSEIKEMLKNLAPHKDIPPQARKEKSKVIPEIKLWRKGMTNVVKIGSGLVSKKGKTKYNIEKRR